MPCRLSTVIVCLSLCAVAGTASAQEDVIVVRDDAAPESATSRQLDRDAIVAMPGRSVDDALRAMSGLHQSAHGGHGKAYQYFLRGFDAVHGTDLAVSLEGIPLNEVSNIHGHGYLDLHVIPPMLLSGMSLRPGTWKASSGSFAVAGSADLHLGLDEPGGVAQITVGTDRSLGVTLGWRPPTAGPGTFLLTDVDVGQGVGEARQFKQLRGAAGIEGDVGGLHARAFVLGYDGRFESPGVLRIDDLDDGDVGFYDAYPGSGGGHSSRVLGAIEVTGTGSHSVARVVLWGSLRRLSLVQNFTGYTSNPVLGDGSLQVHRAASTGVEASTARELSGAVGVRMGLSARLHAIDQHEHGIDTLGAVWEDRYAATALQGGAALWASGELQPTDWLYIEPGLRAEGFVARVTPQDNAPHTAWAPVLAPKLRTAWFTDSPVSLFASYGRGYRSPEVRALGSGPRAPLSIADAAEVGALAKMGPHLDLHAAGFATVVDNELLFDHVAARFLTTGTTRRAGIDVGLTVRPTQALRLEAQLTIADARYVASNERIPFAPPLLGVVGVYVERLPIGIALLTAGLRGWVLGPRPLPGGFVSKTTGTADLTAVVQLKQWSLHLDIDNALGVHWRDGEFLFPSRWDLEQPVSQFPTRHITAGAPLAARLGAGLRF